MKKRFLYLIIFVPVLLLLLLYPALADGENANEEPVQYVSIVYYRQDTVMHSASCKLGDPTTLRTEKYSNTESGKTFFGWFSDDGVLYAPGETVTFTKSTKLYEAYGITVNTLSDLKTNIVKSWQYVKLGADITATDTLGLAWGVSIIDLNGHNMTITSRDDAFRDVRGGLILTGSGTVTYTCTSNSLSDAAVYSTARHGYGDGGQRFWLGKDVTVVSNAALCEIYADISLMYGYPSYRIYGNVSVPHLLHSRGVSIAPFDIYDGAVINVSDDYMFIDNGMSEGILVNVSFLGGEINLGENTEFFEEPSRYNLILSGGSYSKDISSFISTRYRCVLNSQTEKYEILLNPCESSLSEDGEHRYRAVGITVTCTEDGTIDYECMYCGDRYLANRRALGHDTFSVVTKEAVVTKDSTEPGHYTHTCIRCGISYIEYFYPNPSEVYVTIKVRQNGVEETLRVPSSDLFSFSGTSLQIYSFASLIYEYPDGTTKTFRQSDVVALEIPAGTTAINGGTINNVAYGAFLNNIYLEEITIPSSVTEVLPYSFAYMNNLKTINGIEHITKSIGAHAFAQRVTASSLIFDTLELNASSIGNNAFFNVRMKRVYFGANVSSIGSSAFGTDSVSFVTIKEVFLEKNDAQTALEDGNGTTLAELQSKHNIFSSYNSFGQTQFERANVFYDHEYIETVVAPICTADGYTLHSCQNCGESYRDNIVSKTTVSHIWGRTPYKDIASTCSTQGYYAYTCDICISVDLRLAPLNPDNHDYTYLTSYDSDPCTTDHYIIGICECGEEQPSDQWVFETARGHDFSVVIEDVESNCGVPGHKTTKCSRCDEVEREEYPTSGRHRTVLNQTKSVPPTCSATGTNIFTCEVCGFDVNSVTIAVDPDAHTWDEGTVQVAASKNNEGITVYNCIHCDETRTARTPMLPSSKMPTWAIVVIVAGSVLIVAGILLTLYFTLFKKKNASLNYKYKFNTFKK